MNPENKHVRSREEVQAMSRNESARAGRARLERRLSGGEGAYVEYSTDQALRQVRVERTGGKVEDNWFIAGEGEIDGGAFYKVISMTEKGPVSKMVSKEALDALNGSPETLNTEPTTQESMGRLALRLSAPELQNPVVQMSVEAPSAEDAPAEQNSASKIPDRFKNLLDSDHDDGLSDAQRIEAAAVRPVESQDAVDQKYRTMADGKYNEVMSATGDADKAQAASDRVWSNRPRQ